MTVNFIVDQLFPFLIVFLRLGAALMLVPTMGENTIPSRIRLHFALAFTVVVTPFIRDLLPGLPESPVELILLLLGEAVIGLFFGAITRLIMAALHIGGMIFAFQSSLAAANMFDPNQAAQSSLVGNFLGLLAILLLFATNGHHLILRALVDTYVLFPAGGALPFADSALAAARVLADAFRIGLQLASPVLVVGFLLYLLSGLLNRLMPQMMVFFIVLPLQITISFTILIIILGTAMGWFLGFFDDTMTTLFGVG